jgi:hypothetical protein
VRAGAAAVARELTWERAGEQLEAVLLALAHFNGVRHD